MYRGKDCQQQNHQQDCVASTVGRCVSPAKCTKKKGLARWYEKFRDYFASLSLLVPTCPSCRCSTCFHNNTVYPIHILLPPILHRYISNAIAPLATLRQEHRYANCAIYDSPHKGFLLPLRCRHFFLHSMYTEFSTLRRERHTVEVIKVRGGVDNEINLFCIVDMEVLFDARTGPVLLY